MSGTRWHPLGAVWRIVRIDPRTGLVVEQRTHFGDAPVPPGWSRLERLDQVQPGRARSEHGASLQMADSADRAAKRAAWQPAPRLADRRPWEVLAVRVAIVLASLAGVISVIWHWFRGGGS